jgi:hypothetical protein
MTLPNSDSLMAGLLLTGRQATVDAFPSIQAIAGGEQSGAAHVWKLAAADRGFAAVSRIVASGRGYQSGRRRGVEGNMSKNRCEMGQMMFSCPGKGPAEHA